MLNNYYLTGMSEVVAHLGQWETTVGGPYIYLSGSDEMSEIPNE